MARRAATWCCILGGCVFWTATAWGQATAPDDEAGPPATAATAATAAAADATPQPTGPVDGSQPDAGDDPPEPTPHVPAAPAHYEQPRADGPILWQWDDPDDPELAARQLHSGFYTHVQLHGGLFHVGGIGEDVHDGTAVAIALGHSVFTDRLIAFGQYDIMSDESERDFGIGALGFGMAYYLERPNIALIAQLGVVTVLYTDRMGESQNIGGGATTLAAAWEWPIDGGPLAVGASAQLRGAEFEAGQGYLSASVGLSLTYH